VRYTEELMSDASTQSGRRESACNRLFAPNPDRDARARAAEADLRIVEAAP
jgi:hypothetical protein